MQIHDSVLDLIGNTPLVRLNKVTEGIVPEGVIVAAKVEYVNPGGSVKDRIAVLALTDPPKRNAMSLTLRKELMACLQKLESLDEADAIIITGYENAR